MTEFGKELKFNYQNKYLEENRFVLMKTYKNITCHILI